MADTTPQTDATAPGIKNRTKLWIGAGLVLALILIGVTWIVALQFQSPTQRETAAQPPPAQPVTVEVAKGDLIEQTTTMATASQASQRSIAMPLDGDITVVTGGGAAKGSDSTATATPTPQAPAKPKKQVVVRRADFVVLEGLPAHVVSVPGLGTVLDAESKLVLSGGQITTAALGEQSVPVKIASIAAEKTTEGQPDGQSRVTFVPVEGAFPVDWAGHEDVLATLDLSEPLKDVLIVPQRAVAIDASGGGNVLVEDPDGAFTQASVKVLGCVSGMCALGDQGEVAVGSRLRVDQ